MEKSTKLLTGPRLLVALLVIAVVIVAMLVILAPTKTTIRITKGKLGYPTVWSVTTSSLTRAETSMTLARGVAVPGEIWNRINGTVESFQRIQCDGSKSSVMVAQYVTKSVDAKSDVVLNSGKVDGDWRLDWDFKGCEVTTEECTFPDRYFDPTYCEDDKDCCGDKEDDMAWVIALR